MPAATAPARSRLLGVAILVVALAAGLLPVTVASASAQEAPSGEPYEQVVDITFPTRPDARFSNDYHAPRGGGTRVHKSTDVIGEKHSPLYAVVQGTICYITGVDGPEPSWGYHITLCGEDGREYDYLHINNDTPGTDDGQGGPEHAYAPGIRRGVRVARGQLIGWMGDSGNAENTVSHLHFEIHDRNVVDPYGDTRINPYWSLQAALAEGDLADGTAILTDPTDRIAGTDRVGTALELAAEAWTRTDVVVLAPSTTPAPAILAGPLAAALDAPVLTTAPGAVDPRVAQTVRDLAASVVVVVGDLGLTVEEVASAVGLAPDAVTVIDGGDDVATSALVAEEVWTLLGATGGGAADDFPAEGIDGEALAHTGSLLDLDEALFGLADGWLDLADLDEALQETVGALDGPALVATNRQRTDGVLLDGARIGDDRLRVQMVGADPRQVSFVDFFLDDPEFDHRRDQRERHHPYDAFGSTDRGPGSLSVDRLAPGAHTLSALITMRDGTRQELHATFHTGAAAVDTTRRAILALGRHEDPNRAWPDSLVASWYGAVRGLPVLLTDPDYVTADLAAAVADVEELVVVGGTSAISEALLADLAWSTDADVRRLSGPSRYDTALAVADDLVDQRLVDLDHVFAATGRNWPDATTAGAAVARLGGVLVLVDGEGVGADPGTQAWLAEWADSTEAATVLGGPAAVAPTAMDLLARSIT